MHLKNVPSKLIYKTAATASRLLAGLEKQQIEQSSELFRPLIILGPARSGTTLLYQLITHSEKFFAINNFIAAFPYSPILAARAWQILASKHLNKERKSFQSNYGRGRGLGGINQGHTIWARWFDKNDTCQLLDSMQCATFSGTISTLSRVSGIPLALKWPGFAAHAVALIHCLPNAFYVSIDRSTLPLAKSIYQGRVNLTHTAKKPISRAPKNLHLKPLDNPVDDILLYITSVRKEIRLALRQVDEENKIAVSYEKLCSSPQVAVKDIIAKYNSRTKVCMEREYIPHNFKLSQGPDLDPAIEQEFFMKIKQNQIDDFEL